MTNWKNRVTEQCSNILLTKAQISYHCAFPDEVLLLTQTPPPQNQTDPLSDTVILFVNNKDYTMELHL